MSDKKSLSIRSLGLLTSLNVVSAILGVLQTIAMAWIFGATRFIEIYFAATTFNLLLLKLASSGQIGDIFTPIFHRIQAEHGTAQARRAVAAMTNVMILIAVAIAATAACFAAGITRLMLPGFDAEDQAYCATVFLVTAPLMVVQIAGAMFSNFLRAEHHYGVDETLGIVARGVNLALLVSLGWIIGIWAMITGLWVSAIIQLLGTLFVLHRKGYRHPFCLTTTEFRPTEVLRQVPFSLTYAFSSQFFLFALTAALSRLPEGSYAVFSYASQFVAKFQGIILRPIGVVFFNRFSQAIAESHDKVRSYAEHALALSTAVTTLCIVPVVVAGDFLLTAILSSEKFTLSQLKQTHELVIIISCMLFLGAQYLVTRRTNLAIKIVGRQFVSTGLVLVLCGLLCTTLVSRYGLMGAVAVQLIANLGVAIIALIVLWWVDRSLVAIIPVRLFALWAISASIAIAAGLGTRRMLSLDMDMSRIELGLSGVLVASLAIAICFGASLLFRIPESWEIVSKVHSQIRSRRQAI